MINLELRKSADGSFSAYNKDFSQCYHSLKCGALSESLYKHILPTFLLYAHKKTDAKLHIDLQSRDSKDFHQFFTKYLSHISYNQAKKELAILDICFGLGYNTFSTLYFHTLFGLPCHLIIYSPEIDEKMLKNLECFPYPKEFENLRLPEILHNLLTKQQYSTPQLHIELFIGNAQDYLKMLAKQSIDIIYHDAFSPKENPSLWSAEFFGDLSLLLKQDGILSTYSQSRVIRHRALSQGFLVYDCKAKLHDIRAGSLMSKQDISHNELLSQFYHLKPCVLC